ncbi:MAG: hypothetical protein COB15_01680 [Flavobacteriales bacterium]|nr:MAG: hypothetical protein COB15_01680 [Flavobacteriales bacterium]
MNLKHQILFLLFAFLACTSYGQYYAFKSYSLDEGLPQTTIEAIIQDQKGYLWVATHGGAAYFDGHQFRDFTTSEGLINNYVFDIKEDCYGNIWFATNGGVTVYTASEVEPFVINFTEKDGLASNRVMTLLERDGEMIFGTAKGLCSVKFGNSDVNPLSNKKNIIAVSRIYPQFNEKKIRCLFYDSRGQLWVGTNADGVAKIADNTTFYSLEDGIPNNEVLTIKEDNDGNIWIGTANGLAKLTYVNNEVSKILPVTKLGARAAKLHVRSIYFDDDGTLYLSYPYFAIFNTDHNTELGYKMNETFSACKNVYSSGTQVIFKDREENIWLGSSSGGISKFMGKKFEAYTNFYGMSSNSIRGIAQNNNGDYWFATGKFSSRMKASVDRSLITYKELNFIEEIGPDSGVKTNSIWSIFHDTKDNIWIGGIKGLYKYDGSDYELISNREGFLGNATMRIYEDKKGIMWFSTFQGVTCYNPENDSIYSPFKKTDVLYGKRISYFYQDKNNDYWFGTREGLVYLKNGIYKKYEEKDGLPNKYVALIIPDQYGNLWLGTGKGISMFDGEKFTNYSTKDGLNSDTPYLMIFDDDWNLWVGTNKGVDKLTINPETSEITAIKFYGKEEGFIGMETNSNAALKDQNGDLWFGTIGGAVKYQKKYDKKNSIAPKTHITRMRVQYKDTPLKNNMVLSYTNNHLTFDYTGISFTNPKKVRYKLRLLGLNEEWTPELTETYVSYSNLSHGEYTFQLIACNNDGVWNENPVEYSFTITPPFWRTYWFYALVLIVVFSVIYGYVKMKTKRLNKSKKELENKVKERTTELYEQHKELENAYSKIEENNKNITDSIKYAKRIQEAILPTNDSVRTLLPNSFVFYQPKDIISGDFYWVERVGELIYFSVADCTGHGVPGALMSIVGHGGLNQAVYGKDLSKPNEVLDFLNKLVNTTLRQKLGGKEVVRDGMDIVLCSLNMKTRELNYAGAYNPLWIVRAGKMIEIKGDRKPIGNYVVKDGKGFTNHKIQLEKGDVVYLFTDGYADQFGGKKGKKGKKYKYAQFRKFIRENALVEMDKQEKIFKQEFDGWKGNLEQIDDVCILGIKI